jgi:hypothetical protein
VRGLVQYKWFKQQALASISAKTPGNLPEDFNSEGFSLLFVDFASQALLLHGAICTMPKL